MKQWGVFNFLVKKNVLTFLTLMCMSFIFVTVHCEFSSVILFYEWPFYLMLHRDNVDSFKYITLNEF